MSINIDLNHIEWGSIDVITHNDLDGYSANVLMKIVQYFHSNISINIMNIGYNKPLSTTLEHILLNMYNTNKAENKLLIINDLGFTEEDIKLVTEILRNKKNMKPNVFVHVVFCDHHQQSIEFEKCPKSTDNLETFVVTESFTNDKKCGSMILYEYLLNIGLLSNKTYTNYNYYDNISVKLFQYIQHVNNYDCWLWKDKDRFAEKLNMYFSAINNDEFVQSISKIILNINDNSSFHVALENSNASEIIKVREKDIRNTQLLMEKTVKISNFNGEYMIGAVICDKYISSVGNHICEKLPDIDFCMILNPMNSYVSFRGIKPDINLARLSNRLFGGNGHKLSAAARVDNKTMLTLIENHICI